MTDADTETDALADADSDAETDALVDSEIQLTQMHLLSLMQRLS